MSKTLKKFILFLLALQLLLGGICLSAAELGTYAFPFVGRWNPTEQPMLIDDYGFQDIQNLRKDGKRFKGVGGHTLITTAPSTYLHVLNGFQFSKDQPSESHVIVYAVDSAYTPTAGKLYRHTAAIPGTGAYEAAALYTPTSFTSPFRFSKAPAGNMLASNGAETLIWGGNEIEATSFITSSDSVTYSVTAANDYSDVLSNASTSRTATLDATGGNDSYTKLLLHFDGADASTVFYDSSSSGRAPPTVNGNAQIDTAQYVYGTSSMLLDGSGDYLSYADSADWYFGTGDFTVDFRIRFNALPGAGAYHGIFTQYQDANNNYYLTIYNNAGNYQWNFGVTAGGITTIASLVNTTVVTNTWYHVAVVRTGNDFKIFLNGTQQGATVTAADAIPDLAGVMSIGVFNGTYVNGWIDEFRVSKGIARWTSDFTAPSQAYQRASNHFLVGSKRPLQGVKFYVSSANTLTSTLDVKEWQGVGWTSLTVTDGTASGGKTLAQTGSVTWTATGSAKPRYLNGLSLYWYQFHFDAGQATLYYVTTDAPIQSITNIWDGTTALPAKFLKYNGTTYYDYTDEVSDDYDDTYATLSSLASATDSLYIGFLEPQQALEFKFVAGSENSTASTAMSGYFWNGSDWQALAAMNDGTATTTTSMSKGGVVTWQGSTTGTEWARAISDEYPLYYYKITFGGNLDADVKLAKARGATYPATISTYLFPFQFQGRAFLCNEYAGTKNKCIYSVYNAPDIWNGTDSGSLYFGDRTDLTAAAVVYNVFQTAGVEQAIVTKKNETYRVSGDGPSNWEVQRMSGTVGCVAPLSMVSADVTDIGEGRSRNVAIWQSDKGFVMTDGAAIVSISDDIKAYFDPNSAKYIPADRQSKTVAWFDTALKSYKALISSGSGQTYHNVELEYSLKTKEWTKLYRENGSGANPLQSGWKVTDTNGVSYTYGGGKDGNVYRLENGNDWNGTSIASYLWTKDIILDGQTPLFRRTAVKTIRTTYRQKSVGNITIAHYGDQTATVTGTSGQIAPSVITNASTTWYNTQSVQLGPALYHSFKFSASTSVADGLELTGFGAWFEPYTAVR